MMSDYDTQVQVEEQYDNTQETELREMGTFANEPANEDGVVLDEQLSDERYRDILFGYAEERHQGWPGDGSGMDDLQDMMQNEGGDY